MTRTERRRHGNAIRASIRKVENVYSDALKRHVKASILKSIVLAKKHHGPRNALKQDAHWPLKTPWDNLKALWVGLHRQDSINASDVDFDELENEEMDDAIGDAFDAMAEKLSRMNLANMSSQGITIDLRRDAHLNARMARARQENINLINKHKAAYFQDVEEILGDPTNYGLGVKGLVAQLMERGNIWLSRAELIARDQTCKAHAAITQERHKAAGIERYTWSSSLDERVRPMHKALEGKVFSYDNPPVTNDDGETNAPGEDFQCRCVGIPVLPELEENDTEGADTDE